jgi:hypothetical protein
MTTRTFRERVIGKHIKGSSTLRTTLRAILSETGWTRRRRRGESRLWRTLSGISRDPWVTTDADVSRFMCAHLKVASRPMRRAPQIDRTERQLIAKYTPCLNIRRNPDARTVETLRVMRRRDGGLMRHLLRTLLGSCRASGIRGSTSRPTGDRRRSPQ